MEPTDVKTMRMLAEFEGRGEDGVRRALAQQLFGPHSDTKVRMAEEWLAEKEREREAGHRTKATSQTEELVEEAREANRLAKEANRVSKEANRVAMAAFILAAIALALSLGLFID